MSAPPAEARPARRPVSGAVRMRRAAIALIGCGVLGVGLAACETTEQESAKIAHENEAAAHVAAKPQAHAHARARSHDRGDGSSHGHSTKGKTPPPANGSSSS